MTFNIYFFSNFAGFLKRRKVNYSIMPDHTNHYIYYPLGSWIDNDILKISEKMTFISPDMVSWSHVLVAAIAGSYV